MKFEAKRIVFLFLLLCGIVFSAVLIVPRISQEICGQNVSAAVYYDDIQQLASSSDLGEDVWLGLFSDLGVDYVVFSEETDTSFLADYGLLPACIGNAQGAWAFRIPNDEAPKTDTAIALIENDQRNGTLLPEGFGLEENDAAYVKTLELFPEYADRGGEEICRLIQRACVDRGMRLILLHPFTEDGVIISDPDEYSVLSALRTELSSRGIELNGDFSCMDAKTLSPLLLWGSGLMTAALWIWLICRKFLKKYETALYILSVPALAAVCFVFPTLSQKTLMLLCAAVFPSLAAYFLFNSQARFEDGSSYKHYLKLSAQLLLWSVCGGLAVGALMSSREYLLGNDIFSGVKLAEFFPLCLALVLFSLPICKNIRRGGLNIKSLLPVCAVCAVLIAAAGLLLLRSGDLSGGISTAETAMREALESLLYARPRTKEFLVAVPFAALICLGAAKKHPLLALLGAMCCTLECVSVVNTFCHAVAPIHVSIIRTLLGMVMGAILGIMLLAVAGLIRRFGQRRRGENG